MAGLNHSFFLVRTDEFLPMAFGHFVPLPGEVEIHDDLLRYMGDTLAWIPAHNPARGEPCIGLCMYGPTTIHSEGARVAMTVFSAWANLFSLGPRDLDLTGAYGWAGDDPSAGEYERLRLDRDVMCAHLRALAQYSEKVWLGNGELYLLHIGI
jgi:hypothetical protein